MIKVGISSCLLGQKVRFDGGHKRSSFCDDELGRHVNFVPYCPEVGIGMSVPRPTIRLEGEIESPRAVVPKTGQDITIQLADYADQRQTQLSELSGYVLCAKSPSCGMERVRVYQADSNANRKEGMGIFAARVRELMPALPLEEDGRLNDPLLRENFVLRVYVYNAWQQLPQNMQLADLQKFHASQKFTLLAHDQPVYRQLGRELAQQKRLTEEFKGYYIETLMSALSEPASKKNHTNVLQHIQGFFKEQLDSHEKQELANIILEYNEGRQPLMAPLTLIKLYLKKHPDQYLMQQSYLSPYPDDLKLRYGL